MTTNPEPSEQTTTKPMKYFRKELVSMPFFAAGKRVPFEVLSQNSGVIALDASVPENTPIIEALETAAKARRGGIVILPDEQSYLDLKKKRSPVLKKSEPERKQQKLRVLPTARAKVRPSPSANPGAAAAVDAANKTSSPEVGGNGSGDNGGGAKPAGLASPPFVPTLQPRSKMSNREPIAQPQADE